MHITDLRGFLKVLETAGNLIHFKEELSTEYEISAAIKYIARNLGKAVLFDRVKGYDVSVVGNLLGSRQNMAIAFRVGKEELVQTYLKRAGNLIKPRLLNSAPVQGVVIEADVDIGRVIPVLVHHEKDAGPYMTSAVTIAKDPHSGIRGMGLHRIQIKDKDRIGIFLATPPLSDFFAKAEQLNKPLEIAIAVGVDPLTFCAAPLFAPTGVDKFEIAGGFAEQPVELVKCRSVDIEVPANAEFILEGYLEPNFREKEGPFGESSGVYLAYDNPVGRITAITHRSRPIYHALVPFDEEDKILASIMILPYLLKSIREAIPEVRIEDAYMVGMDGFCIVQIDKRTETDPRLVIDYLMQSPLIKMAAVVDRDINISELYDVSWAITTRVYPDRDVVIRSGLPGCVIDPSASELGKGEFTHLFGRVAKVGFDATKPLKNAARFEKVGVPTEVKEKISKLLEGIWR